MMMRSFSKALRSGLALIAQGLLYAIFTIELIGAVFSAVGLWIYRAGVDASQLDAMVLVVSLLLMATAPALSVFALWELGLGKSKPSSPLLVALISLILRITLLIASFSAVKLPWASNLLESKGSDLIVGSIFSTVLFIFIFSRRDANGTVAPPG